MNTKKTFLFRLSTLTLLLAFLFGTVAFQVHPAQADSLPAETCVLVGTTRTCELWATTGTVDLPGGASVPIWGYADSATGAATLPGPAIIANQGETLQVILHNNLGETTGLFFLGQDLPPDLAGVSAGGSTTYTFNVNQPGTFLYEAALLPNSQHQVALGMYGALIVRPDPAFGSVSGTNEAGDLTYDSVVLADGPAYYYRLGESTGPTAFDEVALGSDGTYGSAVTLPVVGLLANSTDTAGGFDGTANSYVDTNVTALSASAFSVEAWVNADVIGTAGRRIIVKDEVGVTGAWLLWFNQGALRFQVRNSTNSAWVIAQSPTTPFVGTTFHVVAVFDGTDAILYLDGVEVARTALGTSTTNTNSLPITIGADSDPLNPRAQIFDGTIDEVAIYESALTGAQIQAHFAAANVSLGMTMTDSTANFTSNLVGETLSNDTDGSSCTIASFTATTLTCVAPLSGGTDNIWEIGDAYTATTILRFAYNSVATAYDDEAALVLSEIDPNLNNSATPATFDMRNYKPKYWLINGKAYPQTDEILTTAGNSVLLRYINAGLAPHTMNLLGLDQSLLGVDGIQLPYARTVTVNTVAPGQTVDALAYIPAATLDGARLALYDGSFLTHNNGAAGFGGMLAFLNVSAAGPGTGGAPTTTNLVVAPSPTNGQVDVTITADVDADLLTTVAAAEYFIDVRGADGSGTAMAAVDSTFDSVTESVTATLLAANVNALASGTHTIYVHGQDALGVWGLAATATLSVEKSGPTTGPVSLIPNPTDENSDVEVSATMSGSVTTAEFYIDSTSSTAHPMTVVGSIATGNILASSDLPSLATGDHTIYVRGQNAAGVWGAFNFAVLHLDKDGPATSGIVLSPNPSGGGVSVAVSATGNDSANGYGDIAAAEYFIDATGADGSGTPMTVNQATPIASLNGTISAVTMSALAEGEHTIFIHSQDSFGHWGAFSSAPLKVDKTGPGTTLLTVWPNPNNGSIPYSPTQFSVRVSATLTDLLSGAPGVNSNIKKAEGFIDTVGANGTGFPFTPIDGAYNNPVEYAYAFIPLSTINALSAGTHQIWVHGQDASNNWGTAVSVDLVIDKTAPSVSAVAAAPNPTAGATSVALTATSTDAATAIASAEWFTGADPGPGNAISMSVTPNGPNYDLSATIDVSTWVNGNYPLNVRAKDAAGNWSSLGSTVLVVNTPLPPFPGLYFSTLGNTAVPTVGGTADNADIYNWNGTAYSRVIDAAGGGSLGLPGGANVDGFDWVDATHFYMSFSGANTTVPGLGAVQDEDVVYYNNGVWSVYFDGTAQGLTNGGQDLDAINIVGGILYFSTVGGGNANSIPGVAAPFDDADIYSWNGASFARVWDASANGLPGNADVDGYVRIDATHFYLSFNGTNTTVPTLGAVPDVNVVYNNAGTWSVFFDGTAHGLVAGTGQDLDAMDIP